MAEILENDKTATDYDVQIGSERYNHIVMDFDYDETNQISSKEGTLVFFDMVTYGYGCQIAWKQLCKQAAELEELAKVMCDRHKCTYELSVTANYY